ncbi:hypothetical protein LTR04_005074 [Oleoguttula sp. CCFEE 6159]|nr:hypothetical protein LTR04_005074 [Oleoguttula sp. CCFEE 6159]
MTLLQGEVRLVEKELKAVNHPSNPDWQHFARASRITPVVSNTSHMTTGGETEGKDAQRQRRHGPYNKTFNTSEPQRSELHRTEQVVTVPEFHYGGAPEEEVKTLQRHATPPLVTDFADSEPHRIPQFQISQAQDREPSRSPLSPNPDDKKNLRVYALWELPEMTGFGRVRRAVTATDAWIEERIVKETGRLWNKPGLEMLGPHPLSRRGSNISVPSSRTTSTANRKTSASESIVQQRFTPSATSTTAAILVEKPNQQRNRRSTIVEPVATVTSHIKSLGVPPPELQAKPSAHPKPTRKDSAVTLGPMRRRPCGLGKTRLVPQIQMRKTAAASQAQAQKKHRSFHTPKRVFIMETAEEAESAIVSDSEDEEDDDDQAKDRGSGEWPDTLHTGGKDVYAVVRSQTQSNLTRGLRSESRSRYSQRKG